ncbi:3-carboxy-cis,cis-muconate cycloisomerase [Streptomyces sp. E11-3]|uniref:3-carboxy-cis,cis-muconate cycloisomerase n=1 Tax=Streptomyces sp. E11-3 TaxID=3110112 RepID=UPI00398192B7
MSSPIPADGTAALDTGLLSPVWAGSAAAASTSDHAFLQAMLDAEAALTRAQAALGAAPAQAADAVTAAARADAFDLASLALRARAGGNPVIPLAADLTRAVSEADPEAADYVHRGATSQDILDTAAMLVASRTLAPLLDDLEQTADLLGRLAAVHRDTPMPGRTLTQHAVPTSFGLKAAGWRALVLDAHDRLARVRAALPVQLGGAAGTLAAFPAYGQSQAARAGAESDTGLRLLSAYACESGLAAPDLPWHVLRTPVAELGSALALCTGALGKIAADVLVLSRTEIGEVAEGSGGGSSAMPHKANPVRATLIASAARQVPALAAVLFGSMVAEDERPGGAWHAEWQTLRDALRLTGGAAREAAELARGLTVLPHRMRANLALTHGLLASEHLLAALAPTVGREAAKWLLAQAVRRAAEQEAPLEKAVEQVLADEPELSGVLTRQRLRELLDPTGYPGSAGALTDRALLRQPEHPARRPEDNR